MTLLTLQSTRPGEPADPSVDHGIQAIVSGASNAETCNTDLAAGPWDFDARPGYGPGSSMGDVIPTGAPRQGELPAAYREASEAELHDRITAAKAALGDPFLQVVDAILGLQQHAVDRHHAFVVETGNESGHFCLH